MKNLTNVTGKTRAKKDGKFIYCPHCYTSKKVYHFAWAGIRCSNPDCNQFNDKNEWLIHKNEITREITNKDSIKYDWNLIIKRLISARENIAPLKELEQSKLDSMPVKEKESEQYKNLQKFILELDNATSELENVIYNLDIIGDNLFK